MFDNTAIRLLMVVGTVGLVRMVTSSVYKIEGAVKLTEMLN